MLDQWRPSHLDAACLTPLAAMAFSYRGPTLRSLLASPVARPTYAAHSSFLSPACRVPPAPCSSLRPYVAPPALSRSARRSSGRGKAGDGGGGGGDTPLLVLVLVVLALRRSPPGPTPTTRIDWPRASPLLCCKCMFQVFQRYVANCYI